MRSISLGAYLITVHRLMKDEEFPLDSIGEDELDLYDIVKDYLEDLSAQYNVREENKTILYCDKSQIKEKENAISEDESYRYIYGILKGGEYGYGAIGRNRKTFAQSYVKTVDDAEEIPLYFLLLIPRGMSKGILLLQRFGTSGVFTQIRQGISDKLKDNNPGSVKINFDPLSFGDVLDDYFKTGMATDISLYNNKLPKAIEDQIPMKRLLPLTKEKGKKVTEENKGYLQVSLKSDRLWKMNIGKKIRDIRSGNSPLSSLVRIRGFKYDEASVTLEVPKGNGKVKRKKFNVCGNDFARTYADITDDVKIVDGHPTFDSIHTEAMDHLAELIANL
jgi:hypothetical protein